MIVEILTDFVTPRETNLKTSIFNITTIDHCGFLISKHLVHRSLYQPVLRLLHIPVEVQTQATIEETGIKTEVPLFRSLPCNILIRNVLSICSSMINILAYCINHIARELVAIVRILRWGEADVRQIVEVTDVTVTVLSPWGTDFQEVQPFAGFCHKRLISDDPTCGNWWEGTPAFALGEVGATISTEDSGQHVFLIVVPVNTTKERGNVALTGIIVTRVTNDILTFVIRWNIKIPTIQY